MIKPHPVLHLPVLLLAFGLAVAAQSAILAKAKHLRDQADVAALQALAKQTAATASRAKSAAADLEAAQVNEWLVEAALDKQNQAVAEAAATAGAEQAKGAIALAPNSSEAHRLRGALLGQMIANGGMMAGMRYGAESTQELDKAIALDPKSADACVSRATGYLYTPAAFGGSDAKAVAMLQKAVLLDPKLDTAHLWLAQAYLKVHQPAQALHEAQIAKALNPDRVFTQYVLRQIEAAQGKPKK